jgi:hypothetical protein
MVKSKPPYTIVLKRISEPKGRTVAAKNAAVKRLKYPGVKNSAIYYKFRAIIDPMKFRKHLLLSLPEN